MKAPINKDLGKWRILVEAWDKDFIDLARQGHRHLSGPCLESALPTGDCNSHSTVGGIHD